MHAKAQVVQMVVWEAVVVVTNLFFRQKISLKMLSTKMLSLKMLSMEILATKKLQTVKKLKILLLLPAITVSFINTCANAAVLPDERIDLMQHEYSGGGITVSGPSILVRKNIGGSVSMSANYYVDMVSSASIDVHSSGSKYSEQRIEKSVGLDYQHDRTSYGFGYTTSDENDYHAKTYSMSVSQTFFGDLTTLGFGFAFGQDIVGKNDRGVPDPDFHLNKDRHKYSISLSQIVTKNLIADLSVESGSDACIGMKENESCLNNPYRSVRWYDEDTGRSGSQAEIYPLTHNTDAIGLRAIYHLPYAATIRTDFRNFSDSWGVKAKNAELRYVQNFNKDFLLEIKYRVYTQGAADFYSDLYPFQDAQNFLARDKELSPFSSDSFGMGVTYTMPWHIPFAEKSTLNFYWDHISIKYDDFRDYANFAKRKDAIYKPGEEPLYSLDADVLRIYLSVWF